MYEPRTPAPKKGPQASDAPLISGERIYRHYSQARGLMSRLTGSKPSQPLRAVDGLDFSILRGETFGLVGESGSGKSTIGRIVCGLDAPTSGSIEFDGHNMSTPAGRRAVRGRVQVIFQDPYASLNPRWRIRSIVAEPIRFLGLIRGSRKIAEHVEQLLVQVGLSAADGARYPHEFSGGQRQRISIARALAAQPEFIVCDEPTSALDVSVQANILSLMKDLQVRYGLTYLFISHDLAVIHEIADTVGVLYLGRLCEVASKGELYRSPRHPYTRLLLAAVPDIEGGRQVRAPIVGEPPDPTNPPTGCAFHPRCPFAYDRCRQETPNLRPAGAAGVACHAVEEGRPLIEDGSAAVTSTHEGGE